MKKYKYPYIPDPKLYHAVMIAKKMLTKGIFFHRAAEYSAKKTGTDPEEVEKYLSIFLGLDETEEESNETDKDRKMLELIEQSLSCIYWSEGDGEINHYMYSIEDYLEEMRNLIKQNNEI